MSLVKEARAQSRAQQLRRPKRRDAWARAERKAMRDAETLTACEVCGWKRPSVIRGHRVLCTHHVVPVACDGPTNPENLMVLCPNCHALAHALWPAVARLAWRGPRTRADLGTALMQLLTDPDRWMERYLLGAGFNALGCPTFDRPPTVFSEKTA